MGNQVSALDVMIEHEFPGAAQALTAIQSPSGTPGTATQAAANAASQKAMGILSFEVATLMRQTVDIWRQLSEQNVQTLREQLQTMDTSQLSIGDFNFRWSMAGTEEINELNTLTQAVAALLRLCEGEWVLAVEKRIKVYCRVWRKESPFSHEDQEELMRTLEQQSLPSGRLEREMALLDSFLAGSSSDPEMPSPRKRKPPTAGRPSATVIKQMQVVHHLQKTSLWAQPLGGCMVHLALALGCLWHRLRTVFGRPAHLRLHSIRGTLGEAGLSLQYARILIFIDRFVSQPATQHFDQQRQELYAMLPWAVRKALHDRLLLPLRQPMDVHAAAELQRTMEYMLSWLRPMAMSTMHWQNERAYGNRTSGRSRTLLVQTLHPVNREHFEPVLVELLVTISRILSRPTPGHIHNPLGSLPNLAPAASRLPLVQPHNLPNKPKPKPSPKPRISRGNSKVSAGTAQGAATSAATAAAPASRDSPRGIKGPTGRKAAAGGVEVAAAGVGPGRAAAISVNGATAAPLAAASPKRASPLNRSPRGAAQRPAQSSPRPATGSAKPESLKTPSGRTSGGAKSEGRGAPSPGAVAAQGLGLSRGSDERGAQQPSPREVKKSQRNVQNSPRLVQDSPRPRDPLSEYQRKLYGGLMSPASHGAMDVTSPNAARDKADLPSPKAYDIPSNLPVARVE